MNYQLYNDDCLNALKSMPENSVDSVVTDPPYGLSFMGRKWDYDVPGVEIWAECLRVLKPGGHLLAFAGTRTQHRMAVKIEDAGFEIRDMIAWVYGSGFPKSLDVSKAIDKAAGGDREVLGVARRSNARGQVTNKVNWVRDVEYNITAPATEAAHQWQGWGTALKPALEPITVARKPLIGTVAANVLEYGTGAINIDGCKIPREPDDVSGWSASGSNESENRSMSGKNYNREPKPDADGRWPANFIHDNGDEVTALLGGASRFFYCAKASKRDRDEGLDLNQYAVIIRFSQSNNGGELWGQEVELARLRVDTGASQIKVIDASGALNKSVTEWNTLLFGSESTGQFQKSTTFTTKTKTSSTTELRILNCFQNLLTNESMVDANFGRVFGGSRAVNVEHGTQQIIITSEKTGLVLGADPVALKTRLRISVNANRNNHVTVKPTDLMRYLCRLVTQPGGVVLDPFMGSGSTGKAAVLEGFRFIGIEREPEYFQIAEARIKNAVEKSS